MFGLRATTIAVFVSAIAFAYAASTPPLECAKLRAEVLAGMPSLSAAEGGGSGSEDGMRELFSALGRSRVFARERWQLAPVLLKGVATRSSSCFDLSTLYEAEGTFISGHVTGRSEEGTWKPAPLNPDQVRIREVPTDIRTSHSSQI